MREEQEQGGARVSGYIDLPRSEIERQIDEWVRSERDRYILKRRLLDGVTYERLADELELDERFIGISSRQIQTVVRKGVAVLLKRIKTS